MCAFAAKLSDHYVMRCAGSIPAELPPEIVSVLSFLVGYMYTLWSISEAWQLSTWGQLSECIGVI